MSYEKHYIFYMYIFHKSLLIIFQILRFGTNIQYIIQKYC